MNRYFNNEITTTGLLRPSSSWLRYMRNALWITLWNKSLLPTIKQAGWEYIHGCCYHTGEDCATSNRALNKDRFFSTSTTPNHRDPPPPAKQTAFPLFLLILTFTSQPIAEWRERKTQKMTRSHAARRASTVDYPTTFRRAAVDLLTGQKERTQRVPWLKAMKIHLGGPVSPLKRVSSCAPGNH